MPYNTRRKSLSLSELGIAVPKRSRAQSHPSPPSTIAEADEPPVKKSKRSHASFSPPPPPPPLTTTTATTATSGPMSPPRTTAVRIKDERSSNPTAPSPPLSPPAEGINRVDVEGINDDIVVATIRQLEQTGNRPHVVKELATTLANTLNPVHKSANPSALISSRLAAYMNRQWPAISPCPLAKDLSPSHPRRLYFFLTTMPRQPMPDSHRSLAKDQTLISPSVSSASAADEDDDRFTRERHALSPSPEVDLSSPELEDENNHAPPTPGAPFSGRNSVARDRSASASVLSHSRRAASPQLEHEERDFKQTANALYEEAKKRRSSSQDVEMAHGASDQVGGAGGDSHLRHQHSSGGGGSGGSSSSSISSGGDNNKNKDNTNSDHAGVTMSIEDPGQAEARERRKNSEDAAALFGGGSGSDGLKAYLGEDESDGHAEIHFVSSPLIQPRAGHPGVGANNGSSTALVSTQRTVQPEVKTEPADDHMRLDDNANDNQDEEDRFMDAPVGPETAFESSAVETTAPERPPRDAKDTETGSFPLQSLSLSLPDSGWGGADIDADCLRSPETVEMQELEDLLEAY